MIRFAAGLSHALSLGRLVSEIDARQQLCAYIDTVEGEALKPAHPPELRTKLHGWLELARQHADRLDSLSVESSAVGPRGREQL